MDRCECGHEKQEHEKWSGECDWFKEYDEWYIVDCRCKKFKPAKSEGAGEITENMLDIGLGIEENR